MEMTHQTYGQYLEEKRGPTVIQGAVWGPNDGDRETYGTGNWIWIVPLLQPEDGEPHAGEMPDEEGGRLCVEGRTFMELTLNALRMLDMIGFLGRASMSSICWRYDYARLDFVNEAPCVTVNTALVPELEAMGALYQGGAEAEEWHSVQSDPDMLDDVEADLEADDLPEVRFPN
jgi:hypothetical protein